MAVIEHGIVLKSLTGIDAESLPTEVLIFKFGENKTSKGTFVLDEAGAKSIMDAYAEHGVELHFDYEHDNRIAAGWFAPAVKPEGVAASNIRWTPPATEKLVNREYRYTSPMFQVDAKKRITRLINVALTNLPATKNAQALVAASERTAKEPNTMGFATVIGLKDDASEGEVEERVVSLMSLEKQVLEFTGKSTVAEAMSLVIKAKDLEVKLAAAEKANAEWEEREAIKRATEEKTAIDAAIDGAVTSGRISLRDTEGQAKLRKFGETFKIEALRQHIEMLPARPARVYQAPVQANTAAAQMAAIEDYKKANPGTSTADAYVALAAERPALFSQEVR